MTHCTSSLKNQAAQSSLFNHTPISSCRNFSTFPRQTVPPCHPNSNEAPVGSMPVCSILRGQNLEIVPGPHGGQGTKPDPSSGGIIWEVEGWDAPRTKVENQSKKGGNQAGPRADTDPSAPGMPLAWWGCVGYSQFPKPLASTTSRPPNPSVSNTGEREDGNTTGWKHLLVLCWPGWNIYMLESTEQQENRELRVQAPG